jgi:hypothetical protein
MNPFHVGRAAIVRFPAFRLELCGYEPAPLIIGRSGLVRITARICDLYTVTQPSVLGESPHPAENRHVFCKFQLSEQPGLLAERLLINVANWLKMLAVGYRVFGD